MGGLAEKGKEFIKRPGVKLGAAGVVTGLVGAGAAAAGYNKLGSTLEYAGTGAALGSFFGPAGTAVGAGLGALYGAYRGFADEKQANLARNWAYSVIAGKNDYNQHYFANGFADGGISSGPKSGYTATLHGTEAVIPLPDNKTIPVEMDFDKLAQKISAAMSVTLENKQSGEMKELLDAVNSQLSKHDEMINHLKESVDINQQLLNNSYT